MTELILAYGAGLLTLINPCVLSVLPLVLASSVDRHPQGPALLALGMGVSFVAFGMLVSTLGYAVGLTPERLALIGASMMMAFGLVLVVPAFSAAFGRITARVAARADGGLSSVEAQNTAAPWQGQFLGGVLLGTVWSPCIGPTLGSAIGLASTGQNLGWVAAIMASFALGVATLIVALGYGSRQAIRQRQEALKALASRSRQIIGLVFLGVGLLIATGTHTALEGWLVASLPAWLVDLSVAL